jgi:hypothetical protein
MTERDNLRAVVGMALAVKRGDWSGCYALSAPYALNDDQRGAFHLAIALIAQNVPEDLLEGLALNMARKGDE